MYLVHCRYIAVIYPEYHDHRQFRAGQIAALAEEEKEESIMLWKKLFSERFSPGDE